MANYWEELTKLVQNFSEETLKKVLEYKFEGLEATREKVRLYEYEDEHFEEIKKLLSVELNDGKLLLVYAIKTKGELSERSSKKRQFDLAKKILSSELGLDGGFFVFYDYNGNFRFSLIHKVYKKGKTDFSHYKRYTYFVEKGKPYRTFLNALLKGDFFNIR